MYEDNDSMQEYNDYHSERAELNAGEAADYDHEDDDSDHDDEYDHGEGDGE